MSELRAGREKNICNFFKKTRRDISIMRYSRNVTVEIPTHIIPIDDNRQELWLFCFLTVSFTNLILILVDKLMFSFQNERCIKYGS